MRWLRSFWFPVTLALSTITFCLSSILQNSSSSSRVKSIRLPYREGELWVAPTEDEIPFTEEGELIRYGKALVVRTARYLGPKGVVASISNRMNCQNCHTYAGTQNFANPFSAVASTYPKYRSRSGRIESIEFRVNDCFQRSMNGATLDNQSREMRAIVAYIKWVGKDVPNGVRPMGTGTQELTLLERAADPEKGQRIYIQHCQRCHGENGQGLLAVDSSEYIYPPLWGDNSFNTGAGLYRISLLAAFVKNNMPYGMNWTSPALTDDHAWDVAAFIVSQPRPVKSFAGDWKDMSKKPYDFPFAPYADNFSELQHKYGPFTEMIKKR